MKLQHYLLTRFNVGVYQGAGGADWFDSFYGKRFTMPADAWMERRLDLFERYCLPSVAQQEEKDFIWLLYMDILTPRRFLDRLNGLIARLGMSNIVPILCDNSDLHRSCYDGKGFDGTYLTETERYITEHLADDTEWILTTRFDNDDMLDKRFTKLVRYWASREQRKTVIDVPAGYYFKAPDMLATYRFTRGSPFASLLEPVGTRYDTIHRLQHTDLHLFGPRCDIGGLHWVHLMHDLNVASHGNRFGDRVPFNIDSFAAAFGYRQEVAA